jgi:hypothetical protein
MRRWKRWFGVAAMVCLVGGGFGWWQMARADYVPPVLIPPGTCVIPDFPQCAPMLWTKANPLPEPQLASCGSKGGWKWLRMLVPPYHMGYIYDYHSCGRNGSGCNTFCQGGNQSFMKLTPVASGTVGALVSDYPVSIPCYGLLTFDSSCEDNTLYFQAPAPIWCLPMDELDMQLCVSMCGSFGWTPDQDPRLFPNSNCLLLCLSGGWFGNPDPFPATDAYGNSPCTCQAGSFLGGQPCIMGSVVAGTVKPNVECAGPVGPPGEE